MSHLEHEEQEWLEFIATISRLTRNPKPLKRAVVLAIHILQSLKNNEITYQDSRRERNEAIAVFLITHR